MSTLTNKEFIERLEEIQEGIYRWTIDAINTSRPDSDKILGTGNAPLLKPSEATESLITLFEDTVRAIVGEEENYQTKIIEPRIQEEVADLKLHARIRNQLRQTIIKASKTILRGEK